MNRAAKIKEILSVGVKWYLVTLISFFVAIVLVYCVPTDLVKDNAIASEIYNKADSAASIQGDLTTATSPATVQIMFSMATHSSDDILYAAMANPYYGESYSALVKEGIDEEPNRTYERYWNGWLVLLKPLLVFFDYGAIKKILLMTFLASLITLSFLCQRKIRYGAMLGFFLGGSYIVSGINIITILPYAFAPILSVLLSIYVLVNHDRGFKRILLGYFIAGALTSYLDFLITPLMVFVVPTIIYVMLFSGNRRASISCMAKRCLCMLSVWAFAYVALWFSKWLVASLIMGYNVISEGLGQVLFRVGAEGAEGASNDGTTLTVEEWNGAKITPINAIKLNMEAFFPYLNYKYTLLIVVFIIALTITLCKKEKIPLVTATVLLGLSPFVWFSIASNHSIIHYHFTFRLLSITVFSLLVLVVYFIDWDKIKQFLRIKI